MHLDVMMHPRNKYRNRPNFQELGKLYPEFGKHVKTGLSGKLTINFKSEESLRALAKVLLKHDFGLDVEIPPEKLVPTIPLRLNYILWMEDLMNFMKIDDVHGVDIGTGAVCVFPLLCAKMFQWKMLASEVDVISIKTAEENVRKNKLDQLITVIPTSEHVILKDLLKNGDDEFSFTMCNPPFFDLKSSDKLEKKKPPRNAETGSENELSTDGGEKAFVLKMIEESLELKNRIKVYSTMLGRKCSLAFCLSELKKRNIDNFTATEFCQGVVKRWGLAWTFFPKDQIDLREAPAITSKPSTSSKSNESTLLFPFSDQFSNVSSVVSHLKNWISELQINLKEIKLEDEDLKAFTFELKCYEDTWSHARRKRRMANRDQPESKRQKLESEPSEYPADQTNERTAPSKELYLNCSTIIQSVRENDQETCRVSLILNDGTGGKMAVETLKQYFINKFGIRDYLHQQNKRNKVKRI